MQHKIHFKRVRKTTGTVDTGTFRDRWNSWIMQQLHHSAKTLWNRLTVLGLIKVYYNRYTSRAKLNILPKLTKTCHMMIINASIGYHKQEHDRKVSCLTLFECQFSRSGFTRLPSGVAPAGDMFKRKSTKSSKTFKSQLCRLLTLLESMF